ncbi:MAG: hypothetical protein OEM43_08090 [Gammaproteobacteria bacterium]|nr:hypothetical protein [Gammaproteobacteria bacterium]
MTREMWDRLAAAGGLMSVVLFVIGWLIYGNGPTVADDPGAILRFFADNHARVIWSMFVQGLGTLAMIWFMSALVMAMLDAREPLLAVAAGMSFVVALALGSAATIMRSGLAFISIGDISPDTVAVIFHLGSVIDTGQNIISAGFFLPVAVAALRTRFIPAWWGRVSLVAGLWAVASTTALNHGGFWSPHGAGFLNLVFYIVWVGGTSILLINRMRISAA